MLLAVRRQMNIVLTTHIYHIAALDINITLLSTASAVVADGSQLGGAIEVEHPLVAY
jgi:hypothetical protein